MDHSTVALLCAYLLLKRRQLKRRERNLRCEKCNPPKYKVNDDDSSTDYSTEYECDCSSNESTEPESETSEESEHENHTPSTPVAQSRLTKPQPNPVGPPPKLVPIRQQNCSQFGNNQPQIPVGYNNLHSRPSILGNQPFLIHHQSSNTIGHPQSLYNHQPPHSRNQLQGNKHNSPSRVPLQAQQNVANPHSQLNHREIMSARKPKQITIGRQMVPPAPRQVHNEFFPVQNKLSQPKLHDPFERQMNEIEYWVRTHRPPCTYGLATVTVNKINLSGGPPPLVPLSENCPVSRNANENVKLSTVPELAKIPLTLVDDVSLSSNKSKSPKNDVIATIALKTSAETITNEIPAVVVDDKVSTISKSPKNEFFLSSHNSINISGKEIILNENDIEESKLSDGLTSQTILSKPIKRLSVRAASTPLKGKQKLGGNKGCVKNKCTKEEQVTKTHKKAKNTVIKDSESLVGLPKVSTKATTVHVYKTDRVTRNRTQSAANKSNESFSTPLDDSTCIFNQEQESPKAIAGPSNVTRITRQTKEFFDDSDTSVLTAPYIRSTKNNTSKTRCQNLSRQRACQAKVKKASKRNESTGEGVPQSELRKGSKNTSSQEIFVANISKKSNSDTLNTNDSSLSVQTPNATKASCNKANSLSQGSRKRTRILQFTSFSSANESTKRKSEPVSSRVTTRMSTNMLRKSCNSEIVNGIAGDSNKAFGGVANSGLHVSTNETSKNLASALDSEDETPVKKYKYFP